MALALLGCALAPCQAQTGALPSSPNPLIEAQRQLERERSLRQRQEREQDILLRRGTEPELRRLPPDEAPCSRIDTIALAGEGAEQFQWVLASASGDGGADPPQGRCLGTESINILLARIQRTLLSLGYVTTRVLAAPQELGRRTLTLTLVPGRVADIRLADGTAASARLAAAIPARTGDLLDLRDIEQGLENLKRPPTAEADIRIEPSVRDGGRPGDSDLVVAYSQRFPLRASLSLDDSGTRATGKTQAGATLAWDNPLGLSDLFYVGINHDASGQRAAGTEGQTAHYAVPYGYWLASATVWRHAYHHGVQGLNQRYDYAGESGNAELKLSRLVYRNQRRKTTLSLRGFRRAARNFIDDTEIEVQRRVTGGWEFGLAHREFIGSATLDAGFVYRRGTGAFGAMSAPEERFGEGSARFGLFTAEVGLNAPFRLGPQKLRYSGLWRAQWQRTPLTPQDRFAVGGRYTVRGFDGEASLLGDSGWLLRNDIGWAWGDSGAELYAGVDYGQVGGPSTGQLSARHLSGGVVGLRGVFRKLNYDLFVGAPIGRPEGFRTARTIAGFALNLGF